MSRTLSLPRLLALLLATVGLVASGLAASPASAAREKLIQGVVVDQAGRAILDVEVRAYDEDGEEAAAALSYDNVRADGEPQPGYFALHVDRVGTFSVTLRKQGYVSRTIHDVTLTRRGRVASLGELELVTLHTTSTAAGLKDDLISPDERGRVVVKVTSDGGPRPTGRIVVKHGREAIGSATLRAGDNGRATVTLDRLSKGVYDLRAYYGGAEQLKPSLSSAVELTVRKQRRHRPNARDWLA